MSDPQTEQPEATTRTPVSRMRRAIAEAMTISAQTPQFTLTRAFSLAGADRVRPSAPTVSYEDLIVGACARALQLHPDVNSSWAEAEILAHSRIHVGVAMALPGGLISPAILDADTLTLTEIAAERRRLREGAERGRLTADELFGATFSVSNLGPLGVEQFQALVIPPQAAILAVGAALETDGDRRMNLSLSCAPSRTRRGAGGSVPDDGRRVAREARRVVALRRRPPLRRSSAASSAGSERPLLTGWRRASCAGCS